MTSHPWAWRCRRPDPGDTAPAGIDAHPRSRAHDRTVNRKGRGSPRPSSVIVVTTLLIPFHQDEPVSRRSIVVPGPVSVVVPHLTSADQWERLSELYDALAQAVARSLRADPPTTVVSGDCLSMLGTLAGAQRAGLDPAVVWFDAHGDLHTIGTSTSGYLGGMALRMALGGDAPLLTGPLGLRPVREDRAVLVDARDLDHAEVEHLEVSDITHTQVDAIGPADLPDGPVIVHIDLDVIDPNEVPGLRFPAPGGPTASTVLAALRRLLDSGRVAVLDIACPWFDPVDPHQEQRRSELLASVLALRASDTAT